MQTSAPTWRTVLMPLGFVAFCIVVAIILWRSFGGDLPLQARPYQVTATVPSADAIFSNTDVRMAGVSVGKVKSVDPRGRDTRITLNLDARFSPLRRGARVIVRSRSLLGEGYIEIAPGPVRRAAIPDGGAIARSNVHRTERLDDVLQTFSPETRSQIRAMTRGMASAFRGRGQDLNDVLGRARPLAGNLQDAVDTLRDQSEPLQELISNGETVFAAAGVRTSALRAAIREGERAFSATASRDRELSATIGELPPFLRKLRAGSAELAAGSGDLNSAVASLRPTAPLVVPALRSMRSDLPAFDAFLKELNPTLRTARAALPAASRTLKAVEPETKPTYDALREVIPFLKLASASKDAVVANFAIISAFTNGTAVTGEGRRIHTASGTLTLWNEIIGGYTKKLPTNTANPYPRPGSSNELATKGVLPAYDCRNAGNALIVPPLGSVPPCRTQGPWTFDGRTASYPRLYLDKP